MYVVRVWERWERVCHFEVCFGDEFRCRFGDALRMKVLLKKKMMGESRQFLFTPPDVLHLLLRYRSRYS